MHEKIHVNPRFLNPSQSVTQNVHFNPHFVGQSATRKQNITSAHQPSNSSQIAKNVTILPHASEEQPNINPSQLPTTIPANVILGRSITRTFNVPHSEASKISNQGTSNSLHFDDTINISSSYSHSNPCYSTSICNSTCVYHKVQHSTSVNCSSAPESMDLQQHPTRVNPAISYNNVSVEGGHLSANSLPHENFATNFKTNLISSYQSESANINLLSVFNDSAKMNSIAPSSHSTSKSSNVKTLASSEIPSTCFINPKFIRKPQLSLASSVNLLGNASNEDAPSIHYDCTTASAQNGSETGQEGDTNSAYAQDMSTKSSGNCNLSNILNQVAEKKEKCVFINPNIAEMVSTKNSNGLFIEAQSKNTTLEPNNVFIDQRMEATCDPNSVFLNPHFLKCADTCPNQKLLAKTSFTLQSPQPAKTGSVERDSKISKLVPAHVPEMSVKKSQLKTCSSAGFKTASQREGFSELTGLVKISLIAQPLVSNFQNYSCPTSSMSNTFHEDACSFAGNRSSGSTAVYVNRNKLIRSSKYATTKQCFTKPLGQINPPNKEINKELRPIMISTRNTLIRRRNSSSSLGILNKQSSSAVFSKINSSLKNKYCSTISPKLRAQKYSFISRSKLVKCATNNLIRRKISPVKSQWGYRSSNKIASYSKFNMELCSTGSRKIVPKVVSNYTRTNSNGNKKSDHFVRIGESMYKSTATTLKRQVPARAISTKGTLSMTCSPIPPGRRWHSGTTWSRCWITDRNTRSTAVVFPSLHSFRISNANCVQESRKVYNLSARKKQFYAPFSTRLQTTVALRRYSSAMSITNKPKLCSSKRLILAAHAEKAQMLQRLIIAAKQRSVYILQRKAARKNITLLLPVEMQPSTPDQDQRPTQTAPSGGKSSSIVAASRASPGGSTTVPYCRFYHRFGRCYRGTGCPYEHNPDRVAICTRFLRGRCHVPKCLFAHTLDKGRMPVCSHFLRDALCTRPQCPYLHVNPNPKAPICEDFLHGHCDKREKCKLQHVLECAEFRETGRCPRAGRCPLPHPTRRRPSSAIRQNSSSSKKGREKIKRLRTVSSGSGRGVLGAPATAKRRKDTKPTKQVLARYFRSDNETAPAEGSAMETSTDAGTTSPGVGSSTAEDQRLAQLKMKQLRIISLVEKMKSRACNSDFINVTLGSSASGKGSTPMLNSGKYKLVDDDDVVFVQPIMEYSADLKLPSFIPLSLAFSPSHSSTSTVTRRPPHMHPSIPLGSFASSAPSDIVSTNTKSLFITSLPGRQNQPSKQEISQLSLAVKTVTLPRSSSLPLSSPSEVYPLGASVKPPSPHHVKASLNTDLSKPALNLCNHFILTSSPSLSEAINASSSQQVMLNTGGSSRLALNSTSKMSVSNHEHELLSRGDVDRT